MANLAPMIRWRAFDADGVPLAGGKVWTYAPGTTTPKASYTDQSGLIPNTNPVILDSSGAANIWLGPGQYKFVVMDKDDVVIETVDKVSSGGGGGDIDEDYHYSGYSSRFSQVFESTGLDDTLQKILLITYTAPQISLSGSSNALREKGTSVSNVTLTAAITKRSDPISAVRFYLNPSTLLDTQTSGGGIPSGGSSTYVYAGPFSDNVTFRAEVDDDGSTGGPTTVSSTTNYPFVYPYYFGAGATGKTGAQIRSDLTTYVIASTASVTRSYTFTSGQTAYFAYPASYGDLTQIFDENNFDVTSGWTKSTKSITGLDTTSQSYTVYEKTVPFGVSGTTTFRFVR